MGSKMLRLLLIISVLAGLLVLVTAGAAIAAPSPMKVSGSTIAVDADAYYKSITGKAAEAKFELTPLA